MRSLLSNPEALQAMMQIQQGIQRLQAAAPPEVLGALVFSSFNFFFKLLKLFRIKLIDLASEAFR